MENRYGLETRPIERTRTVTDIRRARRNRCRGYESVSRISPNLTFKRMFFSVLFIISAVIYYFAFVLPSSRSLYVRSASSGRASSRRNLVERAMPLYRLRSGIVSGGWVTVKLRSCLHTRYSLTNGVACFPLLPATTLALQLIFLFIKRTA